MRREYTITDEAGLHARPASLLVQEANKYKNDILIEYNGRKMTLKSIMVVMAMGIPCNATIAIEVLGENAEAIHEALKKVLVTHSLIS